MSAGKVLLEMTVEIGDGRSDTIRIRKKSDPHDLAVEFVRKNGLGESVIEALAGHIRSHMIALPSSKSTSGRHGDASRDPKAKGRDAGFKPHINPGSVKMTKNMRRNGNAFNRLHKDSRARRAAASERWDMSERERNENIARKKKGMSAISRALSDARTDLNGATNYGDKLFQEGQLHQRQKEQLLELIRKQEDEKKMAEEDVTFRPRISEYAKGLKSSVLEDYRGDRRNEKLGYYAQLREEQEMQECIFRPAISTASVELANRRQESLRRERGRAAEEESERVHDELMKDSERRLQQQAEYATWQSDGVTFKPDIGVNKYRPRADVDDGAFIERLVHSNREKERHMQMIRAEHNADIDPETGQPLFKPVTGYDTTRVNGGPVRGGVPIWDYLYSGGEQVDGVKNQLREKHEEHLRALSNICHTKKGSEAAVAERKRRRARHIFDVLDTHGRGVLDPTQLRLDELEPRIAEDIVPALIDSGTDQLTFDEFYTIVDGLAADDASHIREVLLHRADGPATLIAEALRQREAENCTHRPSLNPISLEIAGQLDRTDEIFDRCVRAQQNQLELRRQRKEEQDKLEMEECTFRPAMHPTTALHAWRSFQQQRAEEGSDTTTPHYALPIGHDSHSSYHHRHDDDTTASGTNGDDVDESSTTFDLARSRALLTRLAAKVREESGADMTSDQSSSGTGSVSGARGHGSSRALGSSVSSTEPPSRSSSVRGVSYTDTTATSYGESTF